MHNHLPTLAEGYVYGGSGDHVRGEDDPIEADDWAGNDNADVLATRVTLNGYGDAFIALFQVSTTNNWNDLVCVPPAEPALASLAFVSLASADVS